MPSEFQFPATGVGVADQAVFLGIDDVSLPLRRNLGCYLAKPAVCREPVLAPRRGDSHAPDNAAAHFYGSVIHEGDRFRMWYYACHWGAAPDPANPRLGRLIEGPVCYAESADGIRWDRPALGQVVWPGSPANNVVRLAELHTEGVHVIKDEKDSDPSRRYKMIYNYRPPNRPFWTIRTAASADGLRWRAGRELPLDAFLEQASLYEFNGLYFANGQMLGRSEGGHASGRQAYVAVSPDFENWLPEYGESFRLPEPVEPEARGADKPYDQAHIGVGATAFGNVLVGLYCIWHNRPYVIKDDWFGIGTTSGDFGLVVSNDGFHFREPVKGHVFLHRDESPPVVPAGIRHARILCQGNGILNVGDETRIYHGRWANPADINDYHAEVALAILPRDRWGALGLFPDAAEGRVWSTPVTLPREGLELALNAEGADGIRVEIADEKFAPLAAFSGSQAGVPVARGGLKCRVRWPGRSPAELGGCTVRLGLTLKSAEGVEPRLFAVYLSRSNMGEGRNQEAR